MISISQLNEATKSEADDAFMQCCTASRWVMNMVNRRPFADIDDLLSASETYWKEMKNADFLEAFEGHPKIGDPDSLKNKYRSTLSMASDEQSSVEQASESIIHELANQNTLYYDKFGFIFIVCATGKSAQQMLDLIKIRISNTPENEIKVAAAEQGKITAIRLKKLFFNDQGFK